MAMQSAFSCSFSLLLLFTATKGQNTSCEATIPTQCSCDENCAFYGDCCPSVTLNRASLGPPHDFLFGCTTNIALWVRPPPDTDFDITTIFVIDSCPASANIKLRQACHRKLVSPSVKYNTPVVGPGGRLFRNAFCAACNGERRFRFPEVDSFSTVRRISKDTPMESIDKWIVTGMAKIVFSIPREAYRFCYNDEVKTCPSETPQGLRTQCERGATFRVSCNETESVYRNEACLRCSEPSIKCRPMPPSPRSLIAAGPEQHNIFIRYTELFDFMSLLDVEQELNASEITSNNTDPQFAILSSITTCTVSISIGALAILIAVYIGLPPFRNFAGLMTITLAVCLLLSYILLLVSSSLVENSIACTVIGHFLHLTFMSSFAWMAMMGFDLLRNFRNTGVGQGGGRKRFIKYAVFGWGFPVLLAIACAILDQVNPISAISPRFGKPRCYFNRSYALLAWMYCPVAAIILFNCVILGILFHFFYKTAQDTRQVRRNHRGMLFLCVKITLILGVVWIVQMISVFIQNEIINFVTSLMTSLQGLAIALTFLLSAQTKKHVTTFISTTQTVRSRRGFESSTMTTTKMTSA